VKLCHSGLAEESLRYFAAQTAQYNKSWFLEFSVELLTNHWLLI
jgi:hypothetical protein